MEPVGGALLLHDNTYALKVQVLLLSFLTGFPLFLACSEEAKVWCEKLNIQYRVEAARESNVNQTTPKRYEDNFRFLNVKLKEFLSESQLHPVL